MELFPDVKLRGRQFEEAYRFPLKRVGILSEEERSNGESLAFTAIQQRQLTAISIYDHFNKRF